MKEKLRVGIIGAGRWSVRAHIPGFVRSDLCEVVCLCDLDRELAELQARAFGIPEVETDAYRMIGRGDLDVIDVCTRDEHGELHEPMARAALEGKKHLLVEKPVAADYHTVRELAANARSKNLKTKVGLTFRYAPAVQYMFELVRDGFIGEPYVFNGFEQNSQWLDPWYPQDKRIHKTPPDGKRVGTDPRREAIEVGSLEGYGAPTIDIGLELVNSDITQLVCTMANMVKERRRTNLDSRLERINWDDADMFIAECANGALYSMQSSFVTVGNYPGIEARIYGSKGAIIARLVEEFGVMQTLKIATKDEVEFRQIDIPDRFWNPGHQKDDRWDTAFYGCLVQNFLEEIRDGGSKNEGNFDQSARVQEIINAAELSHRERRWIGLPLSR
jgi:predicted dehydrogenase